MDNECAREITEWIRWQAFQFGGPRYLPDTLHALFQRINRHRQYPWDVDATLVLISRSPDRKQRIDALVREFYEACCTELSCQEQKILRAQVSSGLYEILGPRPARRKVK